MKIPGLKLIQKAQPEATARDGGPVAWIILDWSGDRRGFETRPDAVEKLKESGCELIPLYTRPDNSELRKAAERVIHCWRRENWSDGMLDLSTCLKWLNDALEGK